MAYFLTQSGRRQVKQIRKGLIKWKPFWQLPEDLKAQIIWCEDPKWLQNKNVDLKGVLNAIASLLSSQIKEKLCLPLLSKVPQFGTLDDWTLRELCDHAKPEILPENSFIFHADGKIKEIILIVCGEACSYREEDEVPGVSPQKLTSEHLGAEILKLVMFPTALSSSDFPIAPKHIKAVTKVEAFVLTFEDLKLVQFKFEMRNRHSS